MVLLVNGKLTDEVVKVVQIKVLRVTSLYRKIPTIKTYTQKLIFHYFNYCMKNNNKNFRKETENGLR